MRSISNIECSEFKYHMHASKAMSSCGDEGNLNLKKHFEGGAGYIGMHHKV